MIELQGRSIFPGLVIGSPRWLQSSTPETELPFRGAEVELQNLDSARVRTEAQIQKLKDIALRHVSAHEAEIFDAHLMMLQDPDYQEQIQNRIRDEQMPSARAIRVTTQEYIDVLSKASSGYLRERTADLRDISERWVRNLQATSESTENLADCILIADDLAPSQVMEFSEHPPRGVILRQGGLTSHTAILLKSLGIPSILGLSEGLTETSGTPLVLNATRGSLIVDADPQSLARFSEQAQEELVRREKLRAWKDRPTKLADGTAIELLSNIGNQIQLDFALQQGAEGVGLYRTEFLFMDRSEAPTEDEQFETYRKALQSLKGRPLVIRTMDIGGDKEIPYLNLPKEQNPFLGVRGLRLSLAYPELFKTQIRALIRASEFGSFDVMFPMVTETSELDAAFAIIDECLGDKKRADVPIRWGMMIEIPANLFAISELATRAAFFSVGTNDLTQYLTACDRMNPILQKISEPTAPSLLRALKHLADQTKAANRPLSICGEMGANPLLVPALIGLGITKFSQTSGMILSNREWLSHFSLDECKQLASEVLSLPTPEAVTDHLKKFQQSHA